MPDEPDPDEVAETFGIDASKERAGPVEEDEAPDRPTGAPAPAAEVEPPRHGE